MGILVVVGLLLSFLGWVLFITVAFQKGTGMGLACLFIPFFWPLFLILNWKECNTWFITMIIGTVMYAYGGGLEALQ